VGGRCGAVRAVHYVADADANSHGYSHCYSCCHGHCYCYCDCHINAYCNANSYAYADPAGYSYSKTSTNAEASPVALLEPVKAGTREMNSRVPDLRAARFLG